MKIVFLDVDGPLIPGRMHVAPGYATLQHAPEMMDQKWRFDPVAVMMIKRLLERTDAKIVWNTTHNMRAPLLIEDALAAGFVMEEFHPITPHTMYPNNKSHEGYARNGAAVSRLTAIERSTTPD